MPRPFSPPAPGCPVSGATWPVGEALGEQSAGTTGLCPATSHVVTPPTWGTRPTDSEKQRHRDGVPPVRRLLEINRSPLHPHQQDQSSQGGGQDSEGPLIPPILLWGDLPRPQD